MNRLRLLKEGLLGLVFPEVCQICKEAHATPGEGYLCAGCRGALRPVERPFCERCGLPFHGDVTVVFQCPNCHEMELNFESARSVFAAQGVGRELIHKYKYNRAFWFEPLFAELLRARVVPVTRTERWDCVVPVPLHPAKLREREFNQAERLARLVSQSTGLPVRGDLLRRVAHTDTQTKLTRAERAANVRAAFTGAGGSRIPSQRVILVDDVFTTGATTNACAGVLRESGAAAVCVWTLARGV
ncbi:MAG: ComF family protein [Verrucomicrobia bacterium]|nr:ComF family protein [Verrucomicrobiota bacterium]